MLKIPNQFRQKSALPTVATPSGMSCCCCCIITTITSSVLTTIKVRKGFQSQFSQGLTGSRQHYYKTQKWMFMIWAFLFIPAAISLPILFAWGDDIFREYFFHIDEPVLGLIGGVLALILYGGTLFYFKKRGFVSAQFFWLFLFLTLIALVAEFFAWPLIILSL